jgi:chromosome partitioning protein
MVIAVINQKGGVAKTTCVHNLGAALSNKGKKVLLVDFDSQASLTISAGLEPLDIKNNITAALKKNGGHIAECIYELKPNLYIIPSAVELAQFEMEMMTLQNREKILDRTLSPVKKDFDYILIDCLPS